MGVSDNFREASFYVKRIRPFRACWLKSGRRRRHCRRGASKCSRNRQHGKSRTGVRSDVSWRLIYTAPVRETRSAAGCERGSSVRDSSVRVPTKTPSSSWDKRARSALMLCFDGRSVDSDSLRRRSDAFEGHARCPVVTAWWCVVADERAGWDRELRKKCLSNRRRCNEWRCLDSAVRSEECPWVAAENADRRRSPRSRICILSNAVWVSLRRM